MTKARLTFDMLPLFADDKAIGEALLGADRACEWKDMVPFYETEGLPKIDPVMGGRYTPSVKLFFDFKYGIVPNVPTAPQGEEHPEIWNTRRQKHRA